MQPHFKINRWLFALAMVVILPSLWLLVSYIRADTKSISDISRSLVGIEAKDDVFELLKASLAQQEALASQHMSDEQLRAHGLTSDLAASALLEALALLDPDDETGSRQLVEQIQQGDNSHVKLEAATTLIGAVTSLSGLEGAIARDVTQSSNLMGRYILIALTQSFLVKETAEDVVSKAALTAQDLMSVPVQSGKFKLVSDAVATSATELRQAERTQRLPQLGQFSVIFAQANNKFEAAIGAFNLALSNGERGPDLPLDAITNVHSEYVNAGIELWGSTIDLHRSDLVGAKALAQRTFLIDVVISVVPVVFGLLAFISVSRAFVARTDKQISTAEHFDNLTGLPNRKTLGQALQTKINQTKVGDTPLSLFVVDLQHFKGLNQRFGETVGDEVLRIVGMELKTRVAAFDFVSRSGGNEFTILSDRLPTQGAIKAFAQEIQDQIKYLKLSSINNHTIETALGASSQLHSKSDSLFNDASIALKRAKACGKGAYRYCDAATRELAHQTDALARDLAKAFERDEIEPFFQPQICAKTGTVLGVEALVRWLHPTKGTLAPGHFFSIAEENGLMGEIERVVRRKALKAVAQMRSVHGIDLHLGLNMTPEALSNAATVDEMIAEIDRSGVPRHLISIEILESVLIDSEHSKQITATVERLSNMGLNVELDDFGTGHSSLSNLRDLRVDRVKVDRSFIAGIHGKPDLQTITLALTQLARTLNVEILAEGVESEQELNWLMAHQCDVIQGFLVARPMPLDRLHDWVGDYLRKMAKSSANENWLDCRPNAQTAS